MAYLHTVGCIHRDLKSSNVLLTRDGDGKLRAKISDFGMSKIVDGRRHYAAVTGYEGEGSAADSPVTPVRVMSHAQPITAKDVRKFEEATKIANAASQIRSAMTTSFSDSASPGTFSLEMTGAQGTYSYLSPELAAQFVDRGSVTSADNVGGHSIYSQAVDVYSYGVILYESLELTAPWTLDRGKYGSVHDILRAVVRGIRPRIRQKSIDNAPGGVRGLMVLCWDQNPSGRPKFSRVRRVVKAILEAVKKREGMGKSNNRLRRSSTATPTATARRATNDTAVSRRWSARTNSTIELTASGLSSERSDNALGGVSARASPVSPDVQFSYLQTVRTVGGDHDWGGRMLRDRSPLDGADCRSLSRAAVVTKEAPPVSKRRAPPATTLFLRQWQQRLRGLDKKEAAGASATPSRTGYGY
eukprot:g5259.t1